MGLMLDLFVKKETKKQSKVEMDDLILVKQTEIHNIEPVFI